ncbi:hypothetical protein PV343_02980 [Streptomyces sp. WI03-4A]|uniref:hypothetical protein n=1 Tax=Streptomyces sp. WI03-4A TaxID=3028706 RepID=UPI0029B62E22|nr:hypothetical protein [Streptomyces sp. WI03-4A]MDX2591286.1 hypothetical protein [Streptomyces sp. WI03-4A]
MKLPLRPWADSRLWATVRPWVIVAFIVLVLLVTTAYLAWFGLEDLMHALDFPGRITGAVLFVASVITFVGALAVLDYALRGCFPHSGLVALIGAVAAFVTNAMLTLEVFRDGDSTAYQVLWGLLTVASALAAFLLWRTRVDIPAPKRVAAAVIVSSVLAVTNFGYQHLYQPYQRGGRPLITLSVGQAMLSQDRKRFAVPVDIRLENHSEMGFYVVGAEFHAMGVRVPPATKDRLRLQWRADAGQRREFRERSPLTRREVHEPGELVMAQPWMDPGDWIEASDSLVTRTVVQLPVKTPYDHLALYATASFGRKDRLGLDHFESLSYSWNGGKVPHWAKEKDIDSVIYRGRVHENNALDEHTRDPRYLSVYWRFGTHGADVTYTVARLGEEDRLTSPRRVVGRYGIVDAGSGPIEQTLWDIKNRR